MTSRDRIVKRSFDLVSAVLGLIFLWPVILVTWIIARRDTGASGFFRQDRIGQSGKQFRIVKLRTMRDVGGTTVTTAADSRITKWGSRFRRWKLDEVPQLWNVLLGQMSIVGPRPDVPGYLDQLGGDDARLLQLRPGVTGPATLKYRDEEYLLASQADPEAYNAKVIWPEKVRINLEYNDNWTLKRDLSIILETVCG
jgi:lipopolysaccharide/colanic/teichoic acid biosynthesis glycosyltransferase